MKLATIARHLLAFLIRRNLDRAGQHLLPKVAQVFLHVRHERGKGCRVARVAAAAQVELSGAAVARELIDHLDGSISLDEAVEDRKSVV